MHRARTIHRIPGLFGQSARSLLASLLMACALGAWAPAALASGADSYRYDTVHSQILFSISHDGFSRPFGRLSIAKGWLRFDPQHWGTAATELDIDLDGLDMGDTAWDKAVLKPDLLDAGQYRYAHFRSTSLQRTDAHHGVLHGELTLHGVTRPIDLQVTFNRLAATIYGMHTVAGFSATGSLSRRAFGITAFGNSIGDQVSIWLEIEAIRDDHAAPAEAASVNPQQGQP